MEPACPPARLSPRTREAGASKVAEQPIEPPVVSHSLLGGKPFNSCAETTPQSTTPPLQPACSPSAPRNRLRRNSRTFSLRKVFAPESRPETTDGAALQAARASCGPGPAALFRG